MNCDPHFKGWAKPGPIPPGLAAGVTLAPTSTLPAESEDGSPLNFAQVGMLASTNVSINKGD